MIRRAGMAMLCGLMNSTTLGGPALAVAAAPDAVSGRWSAVATVGEAKVPFRFDLKIDGGAARGTFFDGVRPANPSSSGSFAGGRLHLEFPSYAAVIDATVHDGVLDGDYVAAGRTTHIHATKAALAAAASTAPDIDGEWVIPYHSPKGETAWRLIVHQTGARAEASILRIDGDTGTLDGDYRDGAFHLSHFAGERGATLEISRTEDDALSLILTDSSGAKMLSALRPAAAAAIGATPEDPTGHTSVRDPNEPLRFSFPDLSGRMVAQGDAQFKGKVVLVNLMGSWCPNCHDEAPFLQGLYKKYKAKGLEIVALDFEQPDQLADPRRLRAFIERYGVSYTVLLAGQPKEVNEKLPQAVGLNAWPTTFLIGRDGKVRGAHVGFTSPGSGARDLETRMAFEKSVTDLLSEAAP